MRRWSAPRATASTSTPTTASRSSRPSSRQLNAILDARPTATALIVHNDATIAALPSVLHARGVRVPDDLSVVSLYSETSANVLAAVHGGRDVAGQAGPPGGPGTGASMSRTTQAPGPGGSIHRTGTHGPGKHPLTAERPRTGLRHVEPVRHKPVRTIDKTTNIEAQFRIPGSRTGYSERNDRADTRRARPSCSPSRCAPSALAAAQAPHCSSGAQAARAHAARRHVHASGIPYPQFDAISDWAKLLDACGTDAGVTVKRTALRHHRPDQQGAARRRSRATRPTCCIVDNPVVSTLAEAGMLTTTDENGLDTSAIAPNILGAGADRRQDLRRPDRREHPGALLQQEGPRRPPASTPPRITDWASLTAALAKVKAAGKKGITFSAIGTEEGSFQFLPVVLGRRGGPDAARLAAGASPRSAVDRLAEEGLRAELGHQQHPDHQLAGVRRPATTRSPRTAPGSSATPRRPASTTASSRSRRRTAAPRRRRPAASSSPSRCRRTPRRYATSAKIVDCLTRPTTSSTTDTTLSLHRARPRPVQAAAGRGRTPSWSSGSTRSGRPRAAPATTSAPSTRRSPSSCGPRCRRR